jgi:hypothetical protein
MVMPYLPEYNLLISSRRCLLRLSNNTAGGTSVSFFVPHTAIFLRYSSNGSADTSVCNGTDLSAKDIINMRTRYQYIFKLPL